MGEQLPSSNYCPVLAVALNVRSFRYLVKDFFRQESRNLARFVLAGDGKWRHTAATFPCPLASHGRDATLARVAT